MTEVTEHAHQHLNSCLILCDHLSSLNDFSDFLSLASVPCTCEGLNDLQVMESILHFNGAAPLHIPFSPFVMPSASPSPYLPDLLPHPSNHILDTSSSKPTSQCLVLTQLTVPEPISSYTILDINIAFFSFL